MKPFSFVFLAVLFLNCTPAVTDTDSDSDTLTVTLAAVASETVAGTAYESSSSLTASWDAPDAAVDHYVVTYVDAVQEISKTLEVDGLETEVTLTGLKSDTAYSVTLAACGDEACTDVVAETSAAATDSTSAEYWQIQGTGNTLHGATKIVQNGNTKAFAFRYGDDAGGDLAGTVRLFYDPMSTNGDEGKGIRIAVNGEAASDAASVSAFTDVGTSYGLFYPPTATTFIEEVATSTPVPMTDGNSTWIRLFFEAQDEDNVARIFYLDSQDGATGLDYNSGAATNCTTAADYADGGGCEPTLVIGVDGDDTLANENITSVRQFKVGYPVLDDWKWDGAANTFMIFTIDVVQNCAPSNMEQGYAVWDGSRWNVQYDDDGCPKKFRGLQAPSIMHRAENAYKLYSGYPNDRTITGVQVPVVGPKRIIYADGVVSGEDDVVDYEDWEDVEDAREIYFLWPDGTAVSVEQEDLFDDFVFYAPTGDLDLQVFYGAMNDGTEEPFLGMAVLVNP